MFKRRYHLGRMSWNEWQLMALRGWARAEGGSRYCDVSKGGGEQQALTVLGEGELDLRKLENEVGTSPGRTLHGILRSWNIFLKIFSHGGQWAGNYNGCYLHDLISRKALYLEESCEGGHVWRVRRSAWRTGRKESVERHLEGIVRTWGWTGLARSRGQRCSSGRCSLCDQMENIGRENRAGKLKNFHLTPLCFGARGLGS